MERRYFAALLLVALSILPGCGSPQDDGATAGQLVPGERAAATAPAMTPEEAAAVAELKAATSTPDAAVREFLSAVQIGNEETAGQMLTDLARQKTQETDLVVAPPGSPTAKFTVTEVEYVTPEKDGAHVASTWTDFDEEGKPHTDHIIWVLRNEAFGWRIAGMITPVIEGQPPLVLNFEDPEDMLRKQEELTKHAEPTEQPVEQQAQQPVDPFMQRQ